MYTISYGKENVLATIQEIEEAEKELQRLEEEYIAETPPCINKKCGFYRDTDDRYTCSWSRKLEQCKDYLSDDV